MTSRGLNTLTRMGGVAASIPYKSASASRNRKKALSHSCWFREALHRYYLRSTLSKLVQNHRGREITPIRT